MVLPALTDDELDHLVAADANTIGLLLAGRYAPMKGADGVTLARDIRDVILLIRKGTTPPLEPQPIGPPLYRCRCGASAHYVMDNKNPGYGRVQCTKCGMRTLGGEVIEHAINHWNRFCIGVALR
jgi:hypothetical protein